MRGNVIWSLGVLAVICLFCNCQSEYSKDAAILSQLPETIDYNFHVQPILSDRCYRCHGPDENARKSDLRLDTRAGLFGEKGSSTGPVRPGKLNKSEVFNRIISDDPEYMMPPPDSKLSLEDEEVAMLAKWIQQGAEWKPHWSFIPPQRPLVPAVEQNDWPVNQIDNFILASLQREGLRPAGEANKETLIRRVTLDLTGLPPTLEEIDDFLGDNAPNSYEKLVDRLLLSPQYGENMAVDWLDLSRYADTHGYQSDFYRPHWPWRDWVIKSLNRNMPYDKFVTWQLAGDLLPSPSSEQILATGFNRNHAQNNEGGIVEEEFRVEYVADRTQTFGTAFLGLTMQCARCHDHKYDPITQKEFYQLFSFFNNVAESGQTTFYQPDMPGPTLLLPDEELKEQISYIKKLTKDKEQEITQYKRTQYDSFRKSAEIPKVKDKVNGMVAHFTLDQVQNNRIPNGVQGGRPGKIIDPVYNRLSQVPPNVVAGKVNNGLLLSGDDALSFPGVGKYSRADPFSVGMWVWIPDGLTNGVILHSNKGSALYTYKGYQVSVEENLFDVRLAHNFPYNSIHLLSSAKVPRNKWIHLALTYDGSSQALGTRLYVDGEKLEMAVHRDNLYKDMVFHPENGKDKSPIETHLKIGARWRGKGFTNGMVDEVKVFDRELTKIEIDLIAGKDISYNELEWSALVEDQRQQLFDYQIITDEKFASKQRDLKNFRMQSNLLEEPIFEVMVMDEMPEPRQAFVLARGAYDQQLEPVNPGTPLSVLSYEDNFEPDRMGLARWLFDPDNPLPARVTVNRFWQHYFGIGLVKTVDDFGSQGERPSHPRLLDWLAVEFVESGWDIKHLQKLLVMSASYRQSSFADSASLQRDVENILISRGPSSRLSAESLRDLVLAASGLLVTRVGGPSVKPYQPDGLWAYNSFSGKYQQDHGDNLYRRSLYTFWKRTNPPPSMNIFDAPSRAYCVVKREKTATPLQALVLMNDPQFLEASRVLGQRVLLKGGDSIESKINYGYRLLTGRIPDSNEMKLLIEYYLDAIKTMEGDQDKALAISSMGEYPVNQNLNQSQLAAYTEIMSTIMNFDATTMKR